ncbi:nitroimidazol reductase NimA-like FMN-containing flavoprotein (pyridoxamine 5'-phosphate oxidase superfamily) [Streptomyces canus]|uniref:helix-turn-helix domain-containing protein n=1 Tax=unclassified Streptomyces TaxID=2593676 RepID=UPI000F651C4D|nr:pyridoxamine 5'-phosphate oxidase family protein [Streptomyces sp. RP5T]RRR76030.1 helix-turn-helix domain-containing protein [Streptomyces sp. RP5T]
MPAHTSPTSGHSTAGAGPGDLGRRLLHRRGELGLTRREVADRAGMAPGYLRYLEESPAAAPGISTLVRLADALATGVTALTGCDIEVPPGRGTAAAGAQSETLGVEECRRLLSTHGVGRLGVVTTEGVSILPVNYSVIDGSIAFRTAHGSLTSQLLGKRVAFEVDHIDEVQREGWSVLVRGRARRVTRPETIRRLSERAHSEPWAGGRRDLWVCVDPFEITGRSIRHSESRGR